MFFCQAFLRSSKVFLHCFFVFFALENFCHSYFLFYKFSSESVRRILISPKTKFTTSSRWPNYGRFGRGGKKAEKTKNECLECNSYTDTV